MQIPERTLPFTHKHTDNGHVDVYDVDVMKVYASPIVDMTALNEAKRVGLIQLATSLNIATREDGSSLLLGSTVCMVGDTLVLKRDEYAADVEEGGELHRLRRFVMAHEVAQAQLKAFVNQPALRLM